MLLSLNFAPKFLIYTMPGNRPGEGGRVRYKAELLFPLWFKFVWVYGCKNVCAASEPQAHNREQLWGFPLLPAISRPLLVSCWWQDSCHTSCLLVVLQNLQYRVKLFGAPGNLSSIPSACSNSNCTALAVKFSFAGSSDCPKDGWGLMAVCRGVWQIRGWNLIPRDDSCFRLANLYRFRFIPG